MRVLRNLCTVLIMAMVLFYGTASKAGGQDYAGNEDPNKKILKQGLLGAGVGAISAGASGGKAGQGALIGAGTNVIGGALLDTITTPSAPRPQPVQYVQAAPTYTQPAYSQAAYPVQPQATYQEPPQPVYVQQAYAPQQEDPTKKILKQGLLGAGVGAISSSASGGSAGKGALIGAGTNVIGGALLDAITGPSQPQPVYVQQAQPVQQTYSGQNQYSSSQPKKKILRKYDSDGKVISEEEIWE